MPKVIPSQRTSLRHVEQARTRAKRFWQRVRAPLARKSEKLRRDFQLDAHYPVLSPGFEQLLGGELVCSSMKKELKARKEFEVIFGVSSLFSAYSFFFDFPLVFHALSGGAAVVSAFMVFKRVKVIKSYEEIIKEKHIEIQNLILNYKDKLKGPSNSDLRSLFLKHLHTWMSSLSTQDCPVPLSDVIQYSLRLDMNFFDLMESLHEILQWPEIYTELTPQELGLIIWSIEDALEGLTVKDEKKENQRRLLKVCRQVRLRLFLQHRTQDSQFPNIIKEERSVDKDIVYKEFENLKGQDGVNLLINSIMDLGASDPDLNLRMVELHEMILDQLSDLSLLEQVLQSYIEILQIIKLQGVDDLYLDDFDAFVNKKALNGAIRRLVIKLDSMGLDTSLIKNILD